MDNTTTATPTAAPVAAAPAPKPEPQVIFIDANGVEIARKARTRGRPLSTEKDSNGNTIVRGAIMVDGEPTLPKTAAPAKRSFYITVDNSGNEISREPRGKGRTRPGYVKHETGDFAGNYVGQPVIKAPKAPKAAPVVAAPVVAETVAETVATA